MCFNETTDVNVNNEDISDQFQFVSRDSFLFKFKFKYIFCLIILNSNKDAKFNSNG